ncbi:Cof-type HAD-IIB family hydrolase [Lactobacillus corticis]|uniref:Haloacid dehalogenase n=1 Tax=Lactobacillus corticis TaxID=2201249 RepID=A0A916QHP7_9LACO|nr:Cof-type HAD-IIB family hydrolase [Lactobacillus corticis]GFZ27159.1 haloacid dehalogenase [Lactobacillus corticis]
MIRLVACDLDGTLFDSNMQISETNRAIIRHAQESGIEFLIATGRAPKESKVVLRDARLTTGFINLNGALVFNQQGDLVVKHPIALASAKKLVTILHEHQFYFEVITADQVYSEDLNARITNIAHLMVDLNPGMDFRTAVAVSAGSKSILDMEQVASFDDLLARPGIEVMKIIAFDSRGHEAFSDILPLIKELGLVASSSSASNLEINAKEAQKGTALMDYAQKRGYRPEEVAAIGDNLNDESMIRMAGTGVAMGNAVPLIKDLADIETKDNNHNGVGWILEQFIAQNARG